jgi:hypothetical protein
MVEVFNPASTWVYIHVTISIIGLIPVVPSQNNAKFMT